MWTRRSVLGALAAGVALPGRAVGGDRGPRLVLVVASGGWDTSFCLDPKPDVGTVDGPGSVWGGGLEDVRSWGEIEVAVNDERRPSVSAFFDRWSDRVAVINGVAVGTLSHTRSLARVLSGHWDERHPDLAAVFGASGSGTPLGAVDLCGLGRFGPYAGTSARWGLQGQARALLDPAAAFASPDGDHEGPWWAPATDERRAMDRWLAGRSEGLVERWPEAAAAVRDWEATREPAVALRDAQPPVGRGMPWGWAASGQGDVDLVVDLLARDLCRSVVVSTRQHWDTHAALGAQHASWNRTCYALDRLLEGLEGAALLDRTTVLVVSEMSRTPVLNGQGGKDHWPWTSFLVAGAGVRGGTRLGGTDELLRGVRVDPESGRPDAGGRELEPAMVLAGVAEGLGLDPATAYPATPVCRGFLSS